jgi:hypothetical protein
MQIRLSRAIVLLSVGVSILCCGTIQNSLAQQSPSVATINELYQRFKPRLERLTPSMIEEIWQAQSRKEPWFQAMYLVLYREKDNPLIVEKFQHEMPCAETANQTRETTYGTPAKQFRCTAQMPAPISNVNTIIFLNLNSANTLESAVVYQMFSRRALNELAPEMPAVAWELHFDILSRVDNARAPAGSYAEYSEAGQKFAVRFK